MNVGLLSVLSDIVTIIVGAITLSSYIVDAKKKHTK